MSAVSFGSLLGSIAAKTTAQPVGIWRSTFDVDDLRAQVGRRFGDGSIEQSLDVVEAINKTAMAWAKEHRPEDRSWHFMLHAFHTLDAMLRKFMDFQKGTCEATYEMIAAATGFARRTIHAHIMALRDMGWLDWVRRSTKAEDGSHRPTASSYFVEVSRLPRAAQIHLRQLLNKKGLKIEDHADRKGSGPTPNRVQRLAERLAKGYTGAVERLKAKTRRNSLEAEAAFVRAEMELMGDIPTDKWAEIRHPGDLAAQQAYCARLGIPFFGGHSANRVIDTPLAEQG
ncbi:hypothetical protein [Novosphingobium sp. KACC 22771]|uniref:hypothetical protein n=1 Tax=Novosphingobium sp. KACC 22771 TaxID=3025670 RepID=UPI002365DDD7|nr:hypothetical protein [Novosphingobium sp. KACC 22771]WDF71451.1 hypothetical protein PQ467_11605 [Novosphingobium sp. KACC 22771]